MKKISFFIFFVFLFSISVFPQWQVSGNNIFNTNTGNVGISNSSPQFKLDVLGYVASHVAIMRHSQNGIEAFFSHKFMTGDNDYAVSQDEDGNTKINTTYSIPFCINGVSKMYLNNLGKLGIGTTNPTHTLTVNGEIKSKKVIVSLNGWADYVFEEDYNLLSIEDLEKFIIENKTLPDMPNEKNILENGSDVGEIQVKLLQKIEELTLYLIEHNREIEKLKEKNSRLEKQVAQLLGE